MPLKLISITELQKLGTGLKRPAGVVVGRDGRVWASDRSGTVSLIRTDGTVKPAGPPGGTPHGLAMDRQGRILVGQLGIESGDPGPLQRLNIDTGQAEVLVSTVEGCSLTASVFPILASDGSIYCSHATSAPSFSGVAKEKTKDGFIFRLDPQDRAHTVTQSLRYASGCCFDAGEKHLYVVQTVAGNVMRYAMRAGGLLGQGQPYGPQFGTIPEGSLEAIGKAPFTPKERSRIGIGGGCAFDQEGNLWVALTLANRIIAISANLTVSVVTDDRDGHVLNRPSSLAFGGKDMRDLYIGQTGSDYIVKTRSPVPGLPLAHQR